MDDRALYPLMAWFSPGYPIGAYCYSHGLEAAVERGLVTDRSALQDWIDALVRHGDGWIDACLFSATYDAARRQNWPKIARLCERARAQRPSPEIALEGEAQGQAFLTATARAWPHAWFNRLEACRKGPVAYPVAVAVACAAHELAKRASLIAFLHGFVANFASAGMRLIPLGQSDGQAVISDLAQAVIETADRAPRARLDDIGTATPMVDWLSIAHETQYTRIFRS